MILWSLKWAAKWFLPQSIKREQINPTEPEHNSHLAVLFSSHMGSWLEGYHGIGQNSRLHFLSAATGVAKLLQFSQTGRSRQGFCSLCPRVGGGSQTPGKVVLDSAAGKRPRPVQKNGVNSSIKIERITDCTMSKNRRILLCPFYRHDIFIFSAENSAQPSQCAWLSGWSMGKSEGIFSMSILKANKQNKTFNHVLSSRLLSTLLVLGFTSMLHLEG